MEVGSRDRGGVCGLQQRAEPSRPAGRDAHILGEKLRLGPDGRLPDVLRRPGRYKTLPNGLQIKDVTTKKNSVAARRFIIVINPERAEHDRVTPDAIVAETKRRLASLTQLEPKRAKHDNWAQPTKTPPEAITALK